VNRFPDILRRAVRLGVPRPLRRRASDRAVPTAAMYFTDPLSDLISLGALRAGQPITRLSPTLFRCGSSAVVVRYAHEAELRQLRTGGFRQVFLILDDNLAALGPGDGLPADYSSRLRAYRDGALAALRPLLSHVVAPSPDILADFPQQQQLLLAPASCHRPGALRHHEQAGDVDVVIASTRSHLADIASISEDLAGFFKARPGARLTTFLGRQAPRPLRALANAQHLPSMSFLDYRQFVATHRFHVALAPARPTPFNLSRSISKLHDHAGFGAAGIYAAHPPYSGVVIDGQSGLLVSGDGRSWPAINHGHLPQCCKFNIHINLLAANPGFPGRIACMAAGKAVMCPRLRLAPRRRPGLVKSGGMILKPVTWMILVSLGLAVAGCTGIPQPGPSERVITEKAGDLAGFTLIPVSADKIGNYLVEKTSDTPGTADVPEAPRIRLMPGDIIRIRIAESKEGGLFAPLATGGTPFDGVRIDDRGTISLPYAGRVKVAGLDPPAVQERIRARLAGVTFEPQVFVELVTGRATSVLVSGEVKAPGRFSMLEGPLTLIDAINKTGGAVKPPHQVDVIIRRGNNVRRLPLSTVLDGNNQNLQPGDEVILQSNIKTFNALGSTMRSAQVEFATPHPTLLDALAQVGGLNNTTSSATGVFVFRLKEPKAYQDELGQWQPGPVIFRFDMSRPETMFLAQAFGVRPNDTVYVTNAPSVEWMRSIQPIAQALSLMQSGVDTARVLQVMKMAP
jgi:polysaccharide export outer membrane protein